MSNEDKLQNAIDNTKRLMHEVSGLRSECAVLLHKLPKTDPDFDSIDIALRNASDAQLKLRLVQRDLENKQYELDQQQVIENEQK